MDSSLALESHLTKPSLVWMDQAVRSVGAKRLLNEVTLRIHAGDAIGVTGVSGSGKSTLLRVLAKLDPLDFGEVRFQGIPLEGDLIPQFRRQVAYVAQRPTMLPGTVADNLAFSSRYGSETSQETPQDSLFEFGAAFLQQDASTLSGGQQQRVAIERTLRMSPNFLLLDEPTTSLDKDSTAEVEQRLVAWREADPERGWIWTSHDRAQLDRMCQRVVIMNAGVLHNE